MSISSIPIQQQTPNVEFINLFLEIAESNKNQIFSTQSSIDTSSDDLLGRRDSQQSNTPVSLHEIEDEEDDLNMSVSICSSYNAINANGIQKQNIIKNILKGFVKYIESISSKQNQQQYCNIYNPNKNISFIEIKKTLKKRIKQKKTRWNMKLKSILVSQRICPVFYNFLMNGAESWLSQSKVQDLDSHKQLIQILSDIINNDQIKQIKTYKKK